MDNNQMITNGTLKLARADAKEVGVKIGHLTTYRVKMSGQDWIEVYENTMYVHGDYHYDAAEAKAAYIHKLLDRTEINRMG